MKKYDTTIIGAGLSGLITAYMLRKFLDLNILLLEKGPAYSKRNKENLLEGIGGSGTVYGGKLCCFPASSAVFFKNKKNRKYWKYLVEELGLPSELENALLNNTHLLGSQKSLNEFLEKEYQSFVIKKDTMRDLVERLTRLNLNIGTEIKTGIEVVSIEKSLNSFNMKGSNNQIFQSDNIILATGRVGAFKFPHLIKNLGVDFAQQSPELGIRLECSINNTKYFNNIGVDKKLKKNIGENELRSFCVCTGGHITRLNLQGRNYFDGHFGNRITTKVNFGIMCRNNSFKDLSFALDYCDTLSSYSKEPISLSEFNQIDESNLQGINTHKHMETLSAIKQYIKHLFDQNLLSGQEKDFKVYLPAIDRYWPEVYNNDAYETSCEGIYTIGDACGISRGYIQALWSGYSASISFIEKSLGKIEFENEICQVKKFYE